MRYRALFLLCLLWANPSWAAITEDAQSTCEGTTTTATCSHTFAATAKIALICVGIRESGGAAAIPTGVTVDGNAATSVASRVEPNNVVAVRLFYYLNPPTGTANVVATGAAGTDFILTAVRSYNGVDTADALNTPANSTSLSASANMDVDSLPSAINQLGVLCGVSRKGTANITYTADATTPVSTEKVDLTHTSGSSQISLAMYEEAGDTTSINMRVDQSESTQNAAVAVSLKPLVTTTTRNRGVVLFP